MPEDKVGLKRGREYDCEDDSRGAGNSRYAITFGDVAVLHVGGVELGSKRDNGFSVSELRALAISFGAKAELLCLSDMLPEELRKENEAATLVIRNGASVFLNRESAADDLLREQKAVQYDCKFWDARRSRTLNKRARYNIVFGDKGTKPSKDYKQCTVQAFEAVPHLAAFRASLAKRLGGKADALCAEGNHYFDAASGIGFHGDSERKTVICLSLGRSSTLRYCWRMPGSSENTLCTDIEVHHGDVYVMSEKATGFDWRCRSKTRVVHGAGSSKYIG